MEFQPRQSSCGSCAISPVDYATYRKQSIKQNCRDFPGGPLVKNLPSSAGDVDSIPDWAIKITHAKV